MTYQNQEESRTAPMPERTQTSAIYDQIRRDIMQGVLAAETKLKTRSLAQRFEVGLSPIREALSRLSSEGWVVQSDRRGFSVVPATVEELRNLHHARCVLNEACLRESIAFGDSAWEEGVMLAYFRLSKTKRPTDIADIEAMEHWNLQHRLFHSSLINGGRSQRLVLYCEQLFDEIERYRRIGLNAGATRLNASDEHKAIADAAVARDSATAVTLLNEHFQHTLDQVEKVLITQNKKAPRK
ncbi:GntR family transcriptional regulator [Pseudorhodobacter sp. W20_MBD10_FR17]|uniref:GntR family transcriptional regulator n=1 Tax=Pseudorhodobacter sp. W20_MBD10_FR17 TaxID=3240266 RepID=UPI003F9C113D